MKIRKVYEEENEKNYYQELCYDKTVLDYLSESYQLWCDAEGLEPLSAEEFDLSKLTKEQAEYITAFITLWEITEDFEKKFNDENFVAEIKSRKYNI